MSACGFSIGDWDCRDGGFLYYAGDGEGYDPQDATHICPHCRTRDFLEAAKDEAESVSFYSNNGISGTGVTIWASAERQALEAHPTEARNALKAIGVVGALEADDSEQRYSVVLCNTQSA